VRPAAKFAETPLEVVRLAPNLGEHTREILREAGLENAEIEQLIERGVVHQFVRTEDAPSGEAGRGRW
jgi:crotonobetainyl-CoA:carnitine CoA-transferase CaiB-like acyl-CoA transferase